ncbi:uncharacterized protein LOC112046279 [Bicyclus anynana]|uniref:Uncharacterized protein LOC112046279 n=1 Tax=Bicyclus anynana TaxID=110368 RepID=A0A6J1N0S0_BICAN|nr:uncharacterized protein LOC112046279 [Bicyclus anynana]
MEQIMQKVHNVDPNNSEEVKEALTGFFQCIPKYKDIHANRLLRELQIVINRFPKYCMSHRTSIETFLISYLSSINNFNVIEAAKCAHALQQVRPGQEKSATPKTSWRVYMLDLCSAAHTLIESIFKNAVELYMDSPEITKNASTPMSVALADIAKKLKDIKDRQALLKLRLNNVLVFIQAVLVEVYPVAKPVQPQTILDVIVRLLSVTSSTKQYEEDICNIKIQTLRTLDALIVCLGSNLIPYSALVLRLVMQTLKWSSEHSSDLTSKVRRTAYNSLSNWLTTLHTHRMSDSSSTWEDNLTDGIITDITPVTKVVQLTIGGQPSRHLSKKAKRKLATTQLQESNLAAYAPGENNKIAVSEEVNNEVSIAALECAEVFLTVCGRFLKPATHKIFQDRLVRQCYDFSSYTDEHLLWLLRALEATRRSAPTGIPPPTQYCLHLYSLLHNSRRAEISKFCSEALLNIRLHLHCSPPSLSFDLDAAQNSEKTSNKRKKVSARNRAVLQSLLGADKVPSADNDEVISIPDEPSGKKQRLESSDTDQISIHSSDSDSSVEEVCDESVYENVEEMEVELVINESKNPSVDDDIAIVTEEQETELSNQDSVEKNMIIDSTELSNHETTEQDMIDSITPKTVSSETSNQVNIEEKTQQAVDINATSELQKDAACNDVQVEVQIELDSGENVTSQTEVNTKQNLTIYEAQTQLPVNISNDTIEEETSLSLEVGYDYPNTGTAQVTVLEKSDDDHIPSTNDTDDIQITCGQVIRSSQEVDAEKKTSPTESKTDELPKQNGLSEDVVENGFAEKTIETTEKVKVVEDSSQNEGTTVEDMLADFVDEVNDDAVEA